MKRHLQYHEYKKEEEISGIIETRIGTRYALWRVWKEIHVSGTATSVGELLVGHISNTKSSRGNGAELDTSSRRQRSWSGIVEQKALGRRKIRDPFGVDKKLSTETSRDCRSHRVHAECMASVFHA